jgi:hypothetical protein
MSVWVFGWKTAMFSDIDKISDIAAGKYDHIWEGVVGGEVGSVRREEKEKEQEKKRKEKKRRIHDDPAVLGSIVSSHLSYTIHSPLCHGGSL